MNKTDYHNIFRRFFARVLDELCFSFVLIFLLNEINALAFIKDFFSEFTPLFSIVIMVFLFVFVETLLISKAATTFGKSMFGIYVLDENNNKLSLLKSFKRALYVFFNGVGLGVLFVMPLSIIVAFSYYKKNKITEWDAKLNTKVITEKISFLRKSASFLCMFFLIFHFLILGKNVISPKWMEDFNNRLIIYQGELFLFIKTPFVKEDGSICDIEEMLNTSDILSADTKRIKTELNFVMERKRMFLGTLKYRERKGLDNVEKEFNRLFTSSLCAIEAKKDMLLYLEENNNSYEIEEMKIRFKDDVLQYLFELGANRLRDCMLPLK